MSQLAQGLWWVAAWVALVEFLSWVLS